MIDLIDRLTAWAERAARYADNYGSSVRAAWGDGEMSLGYIVGEARNGFHWAGLALDLREAVTGLRRLSETKVQRWARLEQEQRDAETEGLP